MRLRKIDDSICYNEKILAFILSSPYHSIMDTLKLENLAQLSVDDRLDLIAVIWQSLQTDADKMPLTEAQKKDLDRRLELLDNNPGSIIP